MVGPARRRRGAPLALASLLLLLTGCGQAGRRDTPSRATPFVFQALDLRQQDSAGRPLWQVVSPEARYDLARRVAQARDLRGEISQQGKPLYRLAASHGTVLNDGEVIQLEGAVTIQRLGREPFRVSATRMRWYPRQQRLELDRRPEAYDTRLRLRSSKATLWVDRDLLELRGNPTVVSSGDGADGLKQFRLAAPQFDWSPGSGALVAPGPVVATSFAAGAAGRRLQAAGLRGNTLIRSLQLLAPVRFASPQQRAWLNAETTILDLNTNLMVSEAPFTAAYGALRIQGRGLRVGLNTTEATIAEGCRLQQPDGRLRADRCIWNWNTNAVLATGRVELQRRANRQTTRAGQLSGRLGADGLLAFTAPGSRVRSTLVFPQGQPGRPSKAAATRP
jgi:lipopolysaccharide export system protein LptC